MKLSLKKNGKPWWFFATFFSLFQIRCNESVCVRVCVGGGELFPHWCFFHCSWLRNFLSIRRSGSRACTDRVRFIVVQPEELHQSRKPLSYYTSLSLRGKTSLRTNTSPILTCIINLWSKTTPFSTFDPLWFEPTLGTSRSKQSEKIISIQWLTIEIIQRLSWLPKSSKTSKWIDWEMCFSSLIFFSSSSSSSPQRTQILASFFLCIFLPLRLRHYELSCFVRCPSCFWIRSKSEVRKSSKLCPCRWWTKTRKNCELLIPSFHSSCCFTESFAGPKAQLSQSIFTLKECQLKCCVLITLLISVNYSRHFSLQFALNSAEVYFQCWVQWVQTLSTLSTRTATLSRCHSSLHGFPKR